MPSEPPLVVVDAANVVGSVPDGWWRDRLGSAERLRDALAPLAETGLPAGPDWVRGGPIKLVMVVEGAARGLGSVPGVRVVSAAGSGDDAIAELARETAGRCLVVTADRGLRARVAAYGAEVIGPRAVWPIRSRDPGPT